MSRICLRWRLPCRSPRLWLVTCAAVGCLLLGTSFINIGTYSNSHAYRFLLDSAAFTHERHGLNVTAVGNLSAQTRISAAPTQRQPTQPPTGVRLLRGNVTDRKGLLTIGLCTVPRDGVSYLVTTVHSLLSNMRPADEKDVTIVVYLGSLNATWVGKTEAQLCRNFSRAIDAGLLQIVQPMAGIYPNFSSITKRTFGDPEMRVHWRTKQNIDYAYIFSYSATLSEFYIHLEDDIIAARYYVDSIRQYIQRYHTTFWFCIRFSSLGFIGKMFHSSDLITLKQYLLLFKSEQPCDLLLDKLETIMTQTKVIKSTTSLFQHRGIISSLNNKTQKLTDKRFKDNLKKAS